MHGLADRVDRAPGGGRRARIGRRYSDCSSSPLLGVNSSRKCGSRSCHGRPRRAAGWRSRWACRRRGARGPSASRPPQRSCGRRPVRELLEPDLAEPLGSPRGEHARAVRRRQDRLEAVGDPRVGDGVDHALHHVEGRDEVEGHPDHDPEPSERDDRPVEPGLAPLDPPQLPGREEQARPPARSRRGPGCRRPTRACPSSRRRRRRCGGGSRCWAAPTPRRGGRARGCRRSTGR